MISGFSAGAGRANRFFAQQVGLWLFMAVIAMLFAAVTSALIIRRSASDWQPIYFPGILWLNTILLLFSSLTLEISRKKLTGFNLSSCRLWLGITTILGFAFLSGQVIAWKVMAAHGLFLPTNPHSSFFYLLTCMHGLHLTGGVLWLCFSFVQTGIQSGQRNETSAKENSLKLTATYWHFLDLLWIYLLIVLLIA